MKLTNGEIYNAKEPLEKLLKERLPVKVSYGLARLATTLEDQLKVIGTVRQGLFKTYGDPNPQNMTQLRCLPGIEEKDEDGNTVIVPNPKFPKFMDENSELMSQEVEIVIDVVTLPDTLEVEPAVLMALYKFIKLQE